MPRLVLVIVALFTAALGPAEWARAQTREFSQTVDLAAGGRLELRATKGSVRLTSWPQERVEIRARIEAPSDVDSAYAQRAVDAAQVEVETTARSVRIRSDYSDVPYRDNRWNRDTRSFPFIHYDIRAPREIDLDLDIDRSDTTITGFEGRLEGETDRSRLDASDLSGRIILRIDRGDGVTIDGIRGSFEIEVDRSDVIMRDTRIEGDSQIQIDRGDLEIALAASQALTLDAEMSRRANFRSDLPVTMESIGREFRGAINGGGPTLRIEADRSEIQLTSP